MLRRRGEGEHKKMIILDIYEVAKLFVARGLHGPTSQPKLYLLFVKIFAEKMSFLIKNS